jgi:hypothetical protein
MIALISSCINPFNPADGTVKSFVNFDDRLKQTIHTIETLNAYTLNRIYLLDNSYDYDYAELTGLFENKLKIVNFKQYQFTNKGINELLMLLAIVDELPDNEPIFKISGRYYPNQYFNCAIADGYDFRIVANDLYSKKGTISTRAYFAANKIIYKEFLLRCLNEVFIYPQRVVGFRSALNAIKQILKPSTLTQSNTSIEFASARVLKSGKYRLQLTDKMGIEGKIAGFEQADTISE